MKLNLKTLDVENLDGSVIQVNFAKELAQVIFQTTQKISEHSFAMDLYKEEEVELTDENKEIIERFTRENFKAFVQVAVNKLLTT